MFGSRMPSRSDHRRQRRSSSAVEASVVPVPEGRMFRREALLSAAAQPPAERFLGAMWSDLCTYGRRGAMAALDFYVVTELFVTDRGKPGGLDAVAWEELANHHKVTKVHRVPLNTVAEKQFSKGVGIGAFLNRRLEEGSESPLSVGSPQSFARIEMAFGVERREEAHKTDVAPTTLCINAIFLEVAKAPFMSKFSANHEMAVQSPSNLLFQWLRRALSRALPEDDALCYLAGAQAILNGADAESESVEEAVGNISAILTDCAPDCARELPMRWHAIQHADADIDPAAALLLPVDALPALHSRDAQATQGEEFAAATACAREDSDSPRFSSSPVTVEDAARLSDVEEVEGSQSEGGKCAEAGRSLPSIASKIRKAAPSTEQVPERNLRNSTLSCTEGFAQEPMQESSTMGGA